MKALTLWRPWTWAITHARGKRVENRRWPPPGTLIGHDLAIHAGLSYDIDAVEFIYSILGERPPIKANCPTGIVAVAHVAGWRVTRSEPGPDRWFAGPIGWDLQNVRVLSSPVDCRGAQGLWTLSEEVEQLVRARMVEVL